MKRYLATLIALCLVVGMTASCARSSVELQPVPAVTMDAEASPLFYIANRHVRRISEKSTSRLKIALLDDGSVLYRSDPPLREYHLIKLEPGESDDLLRRLYEPMLEHLSTGGRTHNRIVSGSSWLEVVGRSERYGSLKLSTSVMAPSESSTNDQIDIQALHRTIGKTLRIADEIIAELEATHTATPYTEDIDWIWRSRNARRSP